MGAWVRWANGESNRHTVSHLQPIATREEMQCSARADGRCNGAQPLTALRRGRDHAFVLRTEFHNTGTVRPRVFPHYFHPFRARMGTKEEEWEYDAHSLSLSLDSKGPQIQCWRHRLKGEGRGQKRGWAVEHRDQQRGIGAKSRAQVRDFLLSVASFGMLLLLVQGDQPPPVVDPGRFPACTPPSN